jgi:hypothetical protein
LPIRKLDLAECQPVNGVVSKTRTQPWKLLVQFLSIKNKLIVQLLDELTHCNFPGLYFMSDASRVAIALSVERDRAVLVGNMRLSPNSPVAHHRRMETTREVRA